MTWQDYLALTCSKSGSVFRWCGSAHSVQEVRRYGETVDIRRAFSELREHSEMHIRHASDVHFAIDCAAAYTVTSLTFADI